jgi:hypothetical protein
LSYYYRRDRFRAPDQRLPEIAVTITRIRNRLLGAPGPPDWMANGELVFNEVDEVLYYGRGVAADGRTATQMVPVGGVGAIYSVKLATSSWVLNGVNTTFPMLDIKGEPVASGAATDLIVSLDGVIQQAGIDYHITATNIVFVVPPPADATIWAVAGLPLGGNGTGDLVVSVKAFGAKGDGVTDDTAAIQDALAAAVLNGLAVLYLPAGRYVVHAALTATLSGNAAVAIRGGGSDVSELVFNADTDGIVVTYASSASFTRDTTTGAALKVNGISVIRGPATTGRDGIRIIGDSANAYGTIQPDTVFDDVVVRGGANGGGWTNCIVAQDVANTSWFHVLCQGPFTASAITSPTRGVGTAGVVIKTTGSRYATQHNFSHCTFNVLGRGLDIYEFIQGIAVANCNFTGGLNGIYWNSNGRQEQLAVSNSQFSTLQTGIYVYNMQNVAVSTCVFYNQNSYVPPASANTWYGLKLDEIDNCAITGCNFMGSFPAQPTALEFGIVITNDTAVVAADAPSVIAGNTFYYLHGQALYTRNNTTNILFTGNAVDHVAGFPVIVADPGTTPICTGNTFGNAPFLSGYPGSGATQLYELTHGAGPFTIAGAVDVRGPVLFAPYTFATLPAVDTWVGHTIRITDRSQRLATSDGANWRFGDGMIVT